MTLELNRVLPERFQIKSLRHGREIYDYISDLDSRNEAEIKFLKFSQPRLPKVMFNCFI